MFAKEATAAAGIGSLVVNADDDLFPSEDEEDEDYDPGMFTGCSLNLHWMFTEFSLNVR